MFLSNHLNFFNGTVIHNAPGSGKLAPLTMVKKAINLIQDNEITNENMLISDASDNSAFIFAKGDIKLEEDFPFRKELFFISQRTARVVKSNAKKILNSS